MIKIATTDSKALTRQGGLSMVELMVAMALGLFLVLALVQILINGKESFGSANHLSRLQETGRIATGLMITDLKRAGYMGGNSDIPNIFGSTGQVNPNLTCATGNNSWTRMVSQPIEGLDDSNAGYTCIPDATYLRGDVVTVRYTAPFVAAGALDDDRLYLRSSLFEGKIFVGSAEAQAVNQVMDTPQNVRELLAYSYFVGDSGRTCNGATVPSLFRVRVDENGLPVVEELLPGIDNLQARYGDGQRYYDADNVPNWDAIVAVRIWLLVRAECAETGFTDGNTYNMGDQSITPNDSFRRQLYSSVVMIRNFRN